MTLNHLNMVIEVEFRANDLRQGGKSEKEEPLPKLWQINPSMQVAYLFNYAGSPWLTQYLG